MEAFIFFKAYVAMSTKTAFCLFYVEGAAMTHKVYWELQFIAF